MPNIDCPKQRTPQRSTDCLIFHGPLAIDEFNNLVELLEVCPHPVTTHINPSGSCHPTCAIHAGWTCSPNRVLFLSFKTEKWQFRLQSTIWKHYLKPVWTSSRISPPKSGQNTVLTRDVVVFRALILRFYLNGPLIMGQQWVRRPRICLTDLVTDPVPSASRNPRRGAISRD